MTPADYFATIVLPTLAEFNKEPDNPRRAYLACITASHLADHVALAVTPNKPDRHAVRQMVRRQTDYSAVALAIVDGVSNGTKHGRPGDRSPFKWAPGSERRREPHEFDQEGGFSEWRWRVSGLSVRHENETHFIDDCVKATVWSFAEAYPALLGSVDHRPMTKPAGS